MSNTTSKDPLARYSKQIKRTLSDAERQAMAAAPAPAGDPRKARRALRNAALKARRKELGLKAKPR